MKEMALIGIAIVGLMTLGFDYFILESFVIEDLSEARKKFWFWSCVTWGLIITPFIIQHILRRDFAVLCVTALVDYLNSKNKSC